MKKLFGPSKTIRRLIRPYSKARKANHGEASTADRGSGIRSPQMPTTSRNLSVCSVVRKHVKPATEKPHPVPERCQLYWSLDEENKRKISNPVYVRQAVQDTFMQRAQGAYSYRRPSNLSVQDANKDSTTNKDTSSLYRRAPVPNKPKPVKPQPPAPNEKYPRKPQAPKRKRFIDTARPIKHIVPSHSRGGFKKGEQLKDVGLMQLEAARKMYNPAPTVLGNLMDKRAPKISELAMKTRKNKYISDTKESAPFFQRLLGWGKKDSTKSELDTISITPRTIEVRKSLSGKEKSGASPVEIRRSEKKGGIFRRSMQGRHEKDGSAEQESKRLLKAQEDRENIISKMKAAAPKHSQELHIVKKQNRDLDLTPQLYSKGSLSMRKSYLPLLPCRQYDSKTSLPGLALTDRSSRCHKTSSEVMNRRPSSFTDQIVNSFKSLLMKIRPRSA